MPSLEKQKSNTWAASPQLERFANCGSSLSTLANMEVPTKTSEYRCVAEFFLRPPYYHEDPFFRITLIGPSSIRMLIGIRMLLVPMLIVRMLIVTRAILMAPRLLLLLSLLCMLMLLTRKGYCAGVMQMHLHTSCMTVTSLVKWRGTVRGATREIMPMTGQNLQGNQETAGLRVRATHSLSRIRREVSRHGRDIRDSSTSKAGQAVPERQSKRHTSRQYASFTFSIMNVLEQLLAFLAANRPFAEVSRLTVVSKTWRRVSLNALKTAPQLILSGFGGSVTDEVVRLALLRVASENLRLVDLSGCHNISPGGMEDILQYTETCSGLKEIDVTECSNEAVLRAVTIRARAVCGVRSALDLYIHLKSLKVHAEEVEEEQDEEEQEDGTRYPFSHLSRLLHASTPLLLFDPELPARKNALLQAAAHGTASDVAMLLRLSFAVGDCYSDEVESYEDESDESDMRTYDVNEEDAQGNSSLLVACRLGNLEIAEILVGAGANVSAAKERGDTALLAAIGAGRFEMVESLLEANADVKAVRRDGASALALSIFSSNSRILNRIPKMIEFDESAEISYVRRLSLAFLAPKNIFRWLKDGQSPRELLGVVCALMASAAKERPIQDRLSHVRVFINYNIDLLEDSRPLSPWTVIDVIEQLVLQESDSVFSDTVAQSTSSIERGVVWVNKPPVQHACRWTMHADRAIRSVAYSADGSRLAHAEGIDVVV
jgi:hypothetical protein